MSPVNLSSFLPSFRLSDAHGRKEIDAKKLQTATDSDQIAKLTLKITE